jgi:steroid delta-isomerase-like uncharacterized protein
METVQEPERKEFTSDKEFIADTAGERPGIYAIFALVLVALVGFGLGWLMFHDTDTKGSPAEILEAVIANEEANSEAFIAKDLDALMDTYTEDVIFVDNTFGDYVEGKDAYTRMNSNVVKFTDPDGTRVVDLVVSEDGTRAASTWEWSGTNFYGKSFDLPFAMINEYRDGKIAKQTIYYASPNAYSQLMGSP